MTSRERALCRKHGLFARSAHGYLAVYAMRVWRMRKDVEMVELFESRDRRSSEVIRPPTVPRTYADLGI